MICSLLTVLVEDASLFPRLSTWLSYSIEYQAIILPGRIFLVSSLTWKRDSLIIRVHRVSSTPQTLVCCLLAAGCCADCSGSRRPGQAWPGRHSNPLLETWAFMHGDKTLEEKPKALNPNKLVVLLNVEV